MIRSSILRRYENDTPPAVKNAFDELVNGFGSKPVKFRVRNKNFMAASPELSVGSQVHDLLEANSLGTETGIDFIRSGQRDYIVTTDAQVTPEIHEKAISLIENHPFTDFGGFEVIDRESVSNVVLLGIRTQDAHINECQVLLKKVLPTGSKPLQVFTPQREPTYRDMPRVRDLYVACQLPGKEVPSRYATFYPEGTSVHILTRFVYCNLCNTSEHGRKECPNAPACRECGETSHSS